jgi:hypothetical protein
MRRFTPRSSWRTWSTLRALPRGACDQSSENRYHFLLGWVAACPQSVTLLPSGRTDDVLAKLRHQYPTITHRRDRSSASFAGAHAGQRNCSGKLGTASGAHRGDRIHFRLDGDSTPHPKTWAACFTPRGSPLLKCWAVESHAGFTVPPQHMFGFEASLLSALTARFSSTTNPSIPPMCDARSKAIARACW